MFQYNNYHDYSSIIVQFCFVLFFASVFPLAPLIALINNTFLLRLSAYKVCYTRQRPIALKSAGLGVWEDVLQVMSVLGILTNCGIMGYTSSVLRTRLTPIIGTAGLVVVLFALEHSILLLKYWLSAAVPRVPIAVQRAQARDRRSLGRRKQVRYIESIYSALRLSPSIYEFLMSCWDVAVTAVDLIQTLIPFLLSMSLLLCSFHTLHADLPIICDCTM
jgi:Calcium-activated chloride channel